MRPYWAVIVDSFRESLNSKVLWVLLALITLLLLAIAPFGLRYTSATKLHLPEIENLESFVKRLASAANEPEDSLRHHVWSQLKESTQTRLAKAKSTIGGENPDVFGAGVETIQDLNRLIAKRDLFNEDQIRDLSLGNEAQTLVKTAANERTKAQQQRLNRLVLSACFPREIQRGQSDAMQVSYLGMDTTDPMPFGRREAESGIKIGLSVFMSVIAAPFGIFVSILVTASIIPNMFDAGSVNLLFSKPIKRALLYLAKFLGGCWFVLINTAYLIFGVWLIFGFRLGIWNHKLLWVIPILTFLFAVYYSVSAFAGIVWKNTIMCIAMAVVFWGLCFGVGFLHGWVEESIIQPQRISKIVTIPQDMLAITEAGDVDQWNPETRTWELAFTGPSASGPFGIRIPGRLVGPIYDDDNERVLAVSEQFRNGSLIEAKPSENYRRNRLDSAPGGTIALLKEPKLQSKVDEEADETKSRIDSGFDSSGFIIVESQGISRLRSREGPGNKTMNLFGGTFTLGPKRGSYRSVGPKDYEHTKKATAACIHSGTGDLFIYSRGRIDVLQPDGPKGIYKVVRDVDILDKDEPALMAVAEGHLLVAGEKEATLLDPATLEKKQSYPYPPDCLPRQAIHSNDGRYFAIVFHNRTAWCFDTETNKDISGRIPKQSSITGAGFGLDNQLLVAVDPVRVLSVDPATGNTADTRVGEYNLLEKAHYYVIRPIHSVFPQPGKLNDTAAYLMMENASMARGPDKSLSGSRVQIEPWKPVWQSGIFTVIMLALACVYITRQEL